MRYLLSFFTVDTERMFNIKSKQSTFFAMLKALRENKAWKQWMHSF